MILAHLDPSLFSSGLLIGMAVGAALVTVTTLFKRKAK